MLGFLNTIFKLKIFLICLILLLGGVIYFMSLNYLSGWSVNNILNIGSLILSIVLPFIIGYYYNIYHNQKSAIEELSKNVIGLLEYANELESLSRDEKFLNEYNVMGMCYDAPFFRKEISMLYILGIYFNNVKWYEHQMYNLPINFKELISKICKKYLEIDPLMIKYDHISLEIITGVLPPYRYKYHNTNDILKEFFDLLIHNSKNSYKSTFKEIFDDLNKVKIEKYNIDGEWQYT